MSGQALARIVTVEVEEKGPDRFHAEARQLAEGLDELRLGLLAEHGRAVVVGTGTKIAGQRLPWGPAFWTRRDRAWVLKTAYSSPCFGTSPVLRVR